MSFLASAACDADAGADGIGLVAGAVAAFAFTIFFIVAAHLWWHRSGIGGGYTTFLSRNAHTVFVLQVAGFAEAADHALTSAHWAWMWFSAGRGAGGTTTQEHFVFFALSQFRWIGEEHWCFRGFALV